MCGCWQGSYYDKKIRRVRDLSCGDTEIYLEVEVRRVACRRYSKPMRVHDQACVIVSQSPMLVLAGDAFAGPKVEGAALSGWAAAEAILKSRA